MKLFLVVILPIWLVNTQDCKWSNFAVSPALPCFTGCRSQRNHQIKHSRMSCIGANSYELCCPATNGLDVAFCEHTNYNGLCVVESLRPETMECKNLKKPLWASSIYTFYNCVRVYTKKECSGRSLVVSPESIYQNDLTNVNLNNQIVSFSECFPMDYKLCTSPRSRRSVQVNNLAGIWSNTETYKGDRPKSLVKRQATSRNEDVIIEEIEDFDVPAVLPLAEELNEKIYKILTKLRDYQEDQGGIAVYEEYTKKCEAHFNEIEIGSVNGLTTVERFFQGHQGRTVYYQVDPKYPRTETMVADIFPSQLRKGSGTQPYTREFAQTSGYRNDHAGHILANLLGGPGDDEINIFPQNHHYNQGIWKQIEALVARVTVLMGQAKFMVNLIYDGKTNTRPNILGFRIDGGPQHVHILTGAVPNPANYTRRRG